MLKLLSALYVAAILTGLGCWAIKKSDWYFWKGIVFSLFFLILYGLFLAAVIYLVQGHM